MEIKEIKDLPKPAQDLFMEVYSSQLDKNPEPIAFAVAWETLKTKLVKQDNGILALSEEFDNKFFTFELSESETKVVMNSENEELVIEAILADNTYNTSNQFFAEEDLQDIANQINTYGSTLPDIDHEKLQSLVQKYGNNVDAIKMELQKEKGIFKKISAIVNEGKLWIQAALDKRYKNHTDKFKKLSIEAYGDKDSTGRIRNPVYMGFTFTNKPKLVNADIVSVKA
jgi:RNA recognition motif-containing protein